jgi:release factor glutamine methyltransferase
VLEALPKDSSARVLDLCTGSCCIAATIAAERPQARVVATDLSPDALAVARANLAALGLAERVELLQGNLFEPVKGRAFQAVVSNPPYVATSAKPSLSREVLREPELALFAGPKGLDVLERIAAQAGEHLEPGGLLALEIGDEQGPAVQELLKGSGYSQVRVEPDLAGRARVALARW